MTITETTRIPASAPTIPAPTGRTVVDPGSSAASPA